MKLLFSDLSNHYLILNALLLVINIFVESQEFEVVKKRIKRSSKKVLRKAMLRSDKDRDSKTQEFETRETSIRSIECSFDLVITLKEEK
jgi:hypothetical protein